MGTAVAVTEFDALIEKISKRGYLWYQFGEDSHGPQVLAGVFQWPTCADVVVLTDDRDSHAYRAPTPIPDVFAPARVHWWYGRSDSTVRQLGTGLPGGQHGVGAPCAVDAPTPGPALRLTPASAGSTGYRRAWWDRCPRPGPHAQVDGPVNASTWVAVALLLASAAVTITLTARAHRRHGPPSY